MAMELLNAVLGPIIDITVGAVGRQIGYVYHYTENIQNLGRNVEELSSVIVEIEEKIEGAKTVGNIIRPKVSVWQGKATRAKVDAEKFLNENPSDGHGRCLKGLCPNICSRYVVSKDAKKKTTDVFQLVEDGNKFETVSRPAPLPSYVSRVGNPDFEAFESRKSAFENIMHSLEDEAVRVIGIYGMGGVGKTAMADKVGAQVENDRNFDEIVKVVVTQNPVVGKIQDELAAQLNLKLPEAIESRKIELIKRLKNGKKILIILDDVWNELILNDIGIPFANENTNGCKIILTTRSESVCQQMEVNRKIPIGSLSREEAWILFMVQMENNIPDHLHEVAKQVCKECAGLPIAILVTGKMLKGKRDSHVWNYVLDQLRKSQPKGIKGVSEKVYASLAVSYHNLDLDEAKTCFLFCSLFPEDFNIPIEYILRYGKGVGVAKEEKTLSSKRDKVHYLVDHLKSHCLLLEGRDDEHVKMHDVIRDVAISIASEEGQHMFLSEMGGNLNEWPRKKTYDRYTAISAGFNASEQIEFPDKLNCTELNTLMLSSLEFPMKRLTPKIPLTFFHGMMKLKVLILKRMKIPEFPASITSLVDMEVLCLEDCDLGDLWWIGNLKKLDMLILQDSNFNLLPAEIGELSHLRMLDLRNCRLISISPGVISSLYRLQELFLPSMPYGESSLQWNLEELKALSQLEALEMHVPPNSNLMELPQDFESSFWDKLAKFRIYINLPMSYWHMHKSSKNTLQLKGVSLSGWAAVLSKRVERLCLEELNAAENLNVYDAGRGSFPKLQRFEAGACQGITEFLSMVIDERSVSHLSVMKIYSCNLEYILSPSMAKVLPQLRILEIMSCKNLKSIVGGCQENDTEEVVIFHQLEELDLTDLPMLVSFYPDSREGCALFTRKVGMPKLRKLILGGVDRVKEIWAGDIPPPPDSSHCNLTIFNCHELVRATPQLQTLKVDGCENLKSIVGGCQENDIEDVVIFHRLEELHLAGLPMLVSFYLDSREGCALQPLFTTKVGLPKLRELFLESLDRVKEIWAGDIPPPPDSSLCNLTRLEIYGWKELVRTIPPAILPSLHRLESLDIQFCDSLREIVGSEAALGGGVASSALPKLRDISLRCLPKLEKIFSVPSLTCQCLSIMEIWMCDRLINLFSSPSTAHAFAPDLQHLDISECGDMKEIVSVGSTGKDVVVGDDASSSPHSLQIIFPRLKHLTLSMLPRLTSICPSGYLLGSESSLKIEGYFEVGCVTDEFELDSSNASVQSEETLEAP